MPIANPMNSTENHVLDRRSIVLGGLTAGAAALLGLMPRAALAGPPAGALDAESMGLVPDAVGDQTELLQKAIDRAALAKIPLHLPAGRYRVAGLKFKSNLNVSGVPGQSVLEFVGGDTFISGEESDGLRLQGLVFDGASLALGTAERRGALLELSGVRDLRISDCRFRRSAAGGLVMRRASGELSACTFSAIATAAVFSEDAAGLVIARNTISDCANNGILVWRSQAGDDGTRIVDNLISGIRAEAGGSGQNGNGVNVFRAGGVLVQGNRITDCAYSAIRANAASNCQIIANSAVRIGEVALYAEFAFQGSIIANNLVDGAAMGISVTNFMPHGGRLAVIQGNVVRNIATRADGSRGVGIAAEADAVITGNVVESAPVVGIQLGWGPATRDLQASSNLVRDAKIGIGVSTDKEAGRVLIANNVISGSSDGAIRAMNHARAIGPDLALESAESYPNLSIYGNITN
jgi:uncharacterized secreted repeat protein (TIGR03808 family)